MDNVNHNSKEINKLYIKNMVCDRCIMVVRDTLKQIGIEPISVKLGEVDINQEIDAPIKSELKQRLESLGFELIDDKRMVINERIKSLLIELVHHNNCKLKTNLSDYLTNKLSLDYSYLSKLFSEINNTTIEKYFIAQKIERVKELLIYDQMSLSEIAYSLNYSSPAHLSSQFKSIIGQTPTEFKNDNNSPRMSLDKV